MRSLKPLLQVLTLCALSTAADAASLDVKVTHLRPTRTVKVSVYNDAESWSRNKAPVAVQEFKAFEAEQTLRIDNLPPGRYAVRVDQDPNSSSLEVPNFALERHGFSGSGTRDRRPPFERAAVDVGEEGKQMAIHLFAGPHY